MSEITFELTRSALKEVETFTRGYSLRVEVTNTNADTDAIFVYARKPDNTMEPTYIFECVASPSQLENIETSLLNQATVVSDTMQTPYFRLNFVEMLFSSPDKADKFWTTLQADVKQLAKNLSALGNLNQVHTVNIASTDA